MKSQAFLREGARSRLDASDDERIEYIQRDRFFSHRAVEAIWNLMLVFIERPKSIRPPCLAIVGDAGAGKTTLLSRFQRFREDIDQTASIRTAVSITAPANASVGILQSSLMFALGVPRIASLATHRSEADEVIREAMLDLGVKVLLVDEIQHLESRTLQHQRISWDWIKWISTTCKVSVVCAGVRGYENFLVRNSQLQTRFNIVQLPRWTPGPALEEFLIAFEQTLPLKKPSKLGGLEMQKSILEETVALETVAGITGGIKRIIEFAAIHAIHSGEERITKEGLSAWRSAFDA